MAGLPEIPPGGESLDTLRFYIGLVGQGLRANADLVVLLFAYYGVSRLVVERAARQGMDRERLGDLVFWVAVGGLVGARLAFLGPSLDRYVARPFGLLQIGGGLYYYGGLAGALAVGAWYARRRGLDLWRVADAFGLYGPLMVALSRFACLVNNTCYGALAPPPWGVLFPGLGRPRYPSDLYEALLAVALFGGLVIMAQRRPPRGHLFVTFVAGYALIRAVVDATRINLGAWPAGADPYLSLAVAVLGFAYLAMGRYGRRLPWAHSRLQGRG